jgi:hypothetical protein
MSRPDPEVSLTERIATTYRKSAHAPHLNRATILSLRSEIRQALGDGWSVLAIYKTLRDEGRVRFSYQAFRRHVNFLLLNKATKRKRPPRVTTATQEVRPPDHATGFTFNPQLREKDLF